jgi:hypothetical protein
MQKTEPQDASFTSLENRQPRFLWQTGDRLSRRFAWYAYSKIDLVAAILLLLTNINFPAIFAGGAAYFPRVSFLDDSWRLDMVFKTQEGLWLTRDVNYTYGPLIQLALSAGPRILGLSFGSIVNASALFPSLACLALAYRTTSILLRAHAPWKKAIYLVLFFLFWAPDQQLRSFYVLFAFIQTIDLIERIINAQTTAWPSVGAALVLVTAFFISTDTGVYSIAAMLIGTAAYSIYHRADRHNLGRILSFGGMSCALAAAALIVLDLALARGASPGFLSTNFQIFGTYRWEMASPISKPLSKVFLSVVGISYFILICGWLLGDLKAGSLVRRPPFLLASSMFVFLGLQSGIVRADLGHVAMGLFPAITLALAVLMGAEGMSTYRKRGDLSVFLALLFTALYTGPLGAFSPALIKTNFLGWNSYSSVPVCPSESYLLDRACLNWSDFKRLSAVATFLDQNTSKSDSLITFPYENIYGDVARRRVSGKILQNYIAVTPALVSTQLDSFEKDKPAAAVYSSDALTGWDEIPNFTRTPELWFYLQSHYEEVREVYPGILILRRNDARPVHSASRSESLLPAPKQVPVQRRRELSLIDNISWPQTADFIKLQMRVDYPIWGKILKPSRLSVIIHLEDGTERRVYVLARPNELCDIWIFPWDNNQLSSYFSSEDRKWRNYPRPAAKAIGLRIDRMDRFSAVPSRINLEKIEAVRLSLR